MEPVEQVLGGGPESFPSADLDRRHGDMDGVDEIGVEELANRSDAASDSYVLPLGGVLGLLLAMSHRPLVVHEKVYLHEAAPPTTAEQPGPFKAAQHDARLASVMGFPGAAGMMQMGNPLEAALVSRADVGDVARIDYAPRTSLPPSNYVQKRQVALSLGVEALGSWTPSGGVEHPTSYRDLLDDMVSGGEPR